MVDTLRSCGVTADALRSCGVAAVALQLCGVVVVTSQLYGVTADVMQRCSTMADMSHDGRHIMVMWRGGSHATVAWHDGGCTCGMAATARRLCGDGGHTPAMLHGSGRTEVVVGVRQQLRCVAVAAWHGGSGWSHGLVMVAVVVSRWLQHGCGGSGSGHTMAVIAVTLRRDGSVA